MKLGFFTAALPGMDLAQVADWAAESGFETLEIACWPAGKAERRYAGVTHVDVMNFGDVQAGEVLELARSTGVAISGLGYYPNPLAPDRDEAAKYVDHIRKVIAATAKLGIGRMNTFVGRDWTKSVDDNWPRFLETWRPIIRFAEEHRGRTHVYELEWRSPAFAGELGAAHAVENPFVFDTLAAASGPQGLLGENPPQELATRMHRLWIDFATDGSLPWAPFDRETRQVYRVAAGEAAYEAPMPAAAFLP